MLNLKEELKEYLDDGSIKWKLLRESITAITKSTNNINNNVTLKADGNNENFISKIKDISQITFQFIDKRKKVRQRLVLEKPKISHGSIFASALHIEPLVKATALETNKDDTPMWVDNEWYKDERNNVFRWLGKKEPTSDINVMKDVITGKVIYINDENKKTMKRVEPIMRDGGTIYEDYIDIRKG